MSRQGKRFVPFLWPIFFFLITAGFYWFFWLRSSVRKHGVPADRLQKLENALLAAFAAYLIYWVAVVAWLLNSPGGTFDAWLDNPTGAAVYGHTGFYVGLIVSNVLFCIVHAIALLWLSDALKDAGYNQAPAAWTTIAFNALGATDNLPYLGMRVALFGGLLWIWWYVRIQSIFLGRAGR